MGPWRGTLVALILVGVVGTVGQLAAQNPERDSLKGLLGINIGVEELNPDAERDGLMTAAIQNDVRSAFDKRVFKSSLRQRRT